VNVPPVDVMEFVVPVNKVKIPVNDVLPTLSNAPSFKVSGSTIPGTVKRKIPLLLTVVPVPVPPKALALPATTVPLFAIVTAPWKVFAADKINVPVPMLLIPEEAPAPEIIPLKVNVPA